MKKVLIVLVTLFIATTGFAQLSIGPKIALNFSKFSTNMDELKSNIKPGFDVGIFARVGKKLHLQPELIYSFKSTEMKDVSNEVKNIKTSFIDVPVLVGYKIFSLEIMNLRAFLGPKFSFLVSDNFSDTFKSGVFDFAGQIGLGVDVLMLTLDLRYDYTFTNIAKDSSTKLNTNAFVISLGWKIL